MFDKNILANMLERYKKDFTDRRWNDEEGYKWKAVKHFQDNWDPAGDDFAAMLKNALDASINLLDTGNHFPGKMIVDLAKSNPLEVRQMFADLFDENREIYSRIELFKKMATELLAKKYPQEKKSHFQDENAISIYLWFRYPDKYYIYKFSVVRSAAGILGSDYAFKKGAFADNIHNAYNFYAELNAELRKDAELENLLARYADDPAVYPDPNLVTMTQDFCYYLFRNSQSGNVKSIPDDGWLYVDFDSGLGKDDWLELLGNSEIFDLQSLQIMKRMNDIGGEASCRQLELKYGENCNDFYNFGSIRLAKRIVNKTGCQTQERPDGGIRYWSVLYTGRKAKNDEDGTWIWKLRPALAGALEEFDLSNVPLYADEIAHPGLMNKPTIPPYSRNDFVADVFMEPEECDALIRLLRRRKNLILQGPPGVGKTYAAKRLAWAMMGEKDETRISFAQFHQSYSYEDFMLGFRPSPNGFELQYGIFYDFCKKAAADSRRDYFFIIDEINRGNLSRIFGELLMLLEKDYRGEEISLAYEKNAKFAVPPNLHLIGMMNTADRSLAMLDYALRRRFSFFDMEPAFGSSRFAAHRAKLANDIFNRLIGRIEALNQEIRADHSLGKGFCIGHSYFCDPAEWANAKIRAREVVDYDILPLLEEYWFDDPDKYARWKNDLHEAIEA